MKPGGDPGLSHLSWRSSDDSLGFELQFGKVQEQAVFAPRGPKIGADNREVNVQELLDRLELDNNATSDQHDESMATDLFAFVFN